MSDLRTGRYILATLLFQAMVLGTNGQKISARVKVLYGEAEKLYAADNATPATDSIAIVRYQQVIRLLGQEPALDDSLLFDSYMKCGILYLSDGKSGQALPFFRNSVRTANRTGRLPHSLLFKPYLYIGSCQYDSYDLDSALLYYKRAEDILESHPGLPESERLYNKTGVLYYESGDYRRSIQYFGKALAIVKSQVRLNIPLIVNYQNNIASAWLKLEDYEKAIAIYKSLLTYHSYRDELLYNIGMAYLEAGQTSEAIGWFRQSGTRTPALYNGMARASLKVEKFDTASRYLQLAIQECGKIYKHQKSPDLGNSFKYAGDLFMALDSPTRALDYYQKAIVQLDREFDDPMPTHNPSHFSGLYQSFLLFDALVAKARAYRKMGSDDTPGMPALVNGFNAYASALALAAYVEKVYYADESRLFLGKMTDTVYKETVTVGYRLYKITGDRGWLEKMFSYAETGKASVLQARLGDPGPELLKGNAREIYVTIRKSQAEAAKLNGRLSASADSATSTILAANIREMEIHISTLQEKLDQYPEYSRGKFTTGEVSVASIQKNLIGTDQAVLSYYYTGHDLYCFYVTTDQFGCIVSPWNPSMAADILFLRNQLGAASTIDRSELTGTVHRVSGVLVDPVYEKIKGKSRLVIIPYNEIGYIPFEALESPTGRRLLIRDFAVTYDYSANLLARASGSLSARYEVLAFAPFSGANGFLPQLKGSSEEIGHLPGRQFSGDQATLQQFLRWSPHYPIIHLATHAIVDDRYPQRSYIAFYGLQDAPGDTLHRLFEQDIYHLDMDSASLVILSACETGAGSLIHGEGIISMSRAFSYAGCKSVITSLWKAGDGPSSFITQRLHHYLQKGEPKDRALQLAKIDYLDAPGIEDRYKAPSYWAHLILLGDYKPVADKRRGLWLIIGAILLFLSLVISAGKAIKYRARRTAPGQSIGMQ